MPGKVSKKWKVVIADDHGVLRKGLRDLIADETEFEVVAEASNGTEALEKISVLRPDAAVLDIDMPGMSGLEVAAELKKRKTSTALVALSMHDEEKIFDRAMDVGFLSFILKDGAISDVVAALRSVLSGKFYISPALSSFTMTKSRRSTGESSPTVSLLTQTERKVLRLISENRSTKEIAEALFVSPRTIDSHRANIAQKLGLKGPNALLRWALENRAKI